MDQVCFGGWQYLVQSGYFMFFSCTVGLFYVFFLYGQVISCFFFLYVWVILCFFLYGQVILCFFYRFNVAFAHCVLYFVEFQFPVLF